MNAFARHGFDVWTMDHENYGKSAAFIGNSDVASGVEDLKVAMEVVARETGRQKYHFLGKSSARSALASMPWWPPSASTAWCWPRSPTRGSGMNIASAEQLDYYRTHNIANAMAEMIRSCNRDKPADQRYCRGRGLLQMPGVQIGEDIPTGTYYDMTANMPLVHPQKVLAPVLLVSGRSDGNATVSDLEELLNLLPNGDRQLHPSRAPPIR